MQKDILGQDSYELTLPTPFLLQDTAGEPVQLDQSRLFDIVGSLFLLVLLAPLLLLITALVFIVDPGPIFFAHRRLGHGGHEFPCLKFRTMVVDAEARLTDLLERDPAARREWARDHKLRDDPRITAIGGLLRTLSLDELPQLLNVLRGEMSLVGPRPIVRGEVYRYGRYFAYYCQVRPGITGLWQVSGRNDVSYRRRVALDVRYARSKSLALDLWIIARTVTCIVQGSGY
ncbi:sugar transferase [uncultured Sphingomonas sp.]|uniref:sugar transferase n=1 Tax=uncultured Sphingomonas sp. TaxID=158754 RepID=UPI0025D2E44F|nr:sugar transferase [uncultured Sphingomonas sp.]